MTPPNQRTNVLFPFWGDSLGGSHIATLLLATNLPANYRPVFIVHDEGPLTKHLEARGLRYIRLPLPKVRNARSSRMALLAQILLSLPRLVAALRTHSIGIVHASDGRMNVTWQLPARMARIPFVWHQHSRYRPSIVANFFSSRADEFISVSEYCSTQVPIILRERVRTIPNPFDPSLATTPLDENRRALRKELAVPKDAFVLGFFGNLEPNKKADVFVSVIERLAKRRPSLQVVGCIFGEPREPTASIIRSQIRNASLTDHVRLMGFRYPPEAHIAGCDVLLDCAADDSFGRTIVEAMLVGVPVIASDSGGHAEIIRDGRNGTLVPTNDVEKYVDRVLFLADRGRCEETLSRIREEAIARFSVSSHVDAVVRTYDDLRSPLR